MKIIVMRDGFATSRENHRVYTSVADVEGGQGGPWPTLRLENGLYTIGKKRKK